MPDPLTICLATANPHKLRECAELFAAAGVAVAGTTRAGEVAADPEVGPPLEGPALSGPPPGRHGGRPSPSAAALRWRLVDASACGGMPKVDESAPDFAGNAALKARALRARAPAGWWLLADDSGLAVDALDGAPGVRSARFAGADGDSAANNRKLLADLAGLPPEQRGARFVCVLCLIDPAGSEHFFTGTCAGRILEAPQGTGGFGYDPLFQPDGDTRSFASMPPAEKNHQSHRARAVAACAQWLMNK
jgi:XTP/dITP diphosphohydrolase